MVLASICICLIYHILLFRDLKLKVMVGICHPVLFLLISAGNLCVHCTKLGPSAVSGNYTGKYVHLSKASRCSKIV